MLTDTVVAVVDHATLSAALTAIHRAGYGHTARALDRTRGDLSTQLQRAGIPIATGPDEITRADLLLIVQAAARSAAAAALLTAAGAAPVYIVSRPGTWREVGVPIIDLPPVPAVEAPLGP